MNIQDAKQKYKSQRHGAKRRGIEWQFTFQTWIEFWGADWERRGVGPDKLCMQRYHDKGPYSPQNCVKDVPKRNAITRGNGRRRDAALRGKQWLEHQRDVSDAVEKDYEELSEDEIEIRKMFGLRSPLSMNFVR